jgi:two-component system, NtrC family, sensor kinase
MFRSVDLTTLIENVRYLMEHQLLKKRIKTDIVIPPAPLVVQADPDLLQQVFINLFSNSLHAASPDGGTIKIRANTPAGASEDGDASVIFEDNGTGIPPEHIDHIFDPFFTTKDVGEGAGLGLSVTYGIIKEHGGDIRVESEPGRLTRFIIQLPRRRPS